MSTGAAPVFVSSTKSMTTGSSDSTSLMTTAADAGPAVASSAAMVAKEPIRARLFMARTLSVPALRVALTRDTRSVKLATLRALPCGAVMDVTEPQPRWRHRLTLLRGHARRSYAVAFYEPAQRRGKFAVLGSGAGSVELAALVHPPLPWDDAMFEVLAAAAEADDGKRSELVDAVALGIDRELAHARARSAADGAAAAGARRRRGRAAPATVRRRVARSGSG